ncbi:MAG: nuclear transport factor 2 family protein [Firmicutes bacterium]|nr:nuclear transport factor 2 family protein [Bacillota bacterium]
MSNLAYPSEHFSKYQNTINSCSFDEVAKLLTSNASFSHYGKTMKNLEEIKEFHENFWNTIKDVKWWATDIETIYSDDKCQVYAYSYNYTGMVNGERVEGKGKTTDIFIKNNKTNKWELLHAHSSSSAPNHDD